MEQYLEAGKIVNTHGVHGDVKVESWCDSPGVLAKLPALYLREGTDMRACKIEKASLFKGMVLCHLAGCDTMEDAIRLKNRTVYASRSDLPLKEGAFFVADLIGLPVYDQNTGRLLGKLHDVMANGGRELYEIDTNNGMVLVPAVPAFVCKIDLEQGIFLTPIEGMFSEPAEEDRDEI